MVIISAPSGAGKTTIIKQIMQENIYNLEFSISACSRKKREQEIDGTDYWFLCADDFKAKINNNEFIEWEEVYENQFYGTLKTEVDRIWNTGKNIIFDVDVRGAMNIKNLYPQAAISIFIKPPSIDILRQRLIQRSSESEESLDKRIRKAEWELQFENNFDIIVVNDELPKAVYQINNFLKLFLEIEKK